MSPVIKPLGNLIVISGFFIVLTHLQGVESVCNGIDEPNSTRNPTQSSFSTGDTVTYTCVLGYSLTSGSDERTCQSDSTWTGSTPVCTIVTCSSPASVPNSSRSPDQAIYTYSTSVTYTCDNDYSHISGDLTRVCQADSTWSGIEPVCSRNIQIFSFEPTGAGNTCSSPPTVPNSLRSPDQATYNHMTSITYLCETGYSHTSGDLIRVCQTNSTWSGNEPVCTINTCGGPPAVPNSSKSPDQPIYNYGTSIVYTCNTGYSKVSGDLTRNCQADSSWSGTEPLCTINTCASPAAVSFASVSPSQASYDYDTSITYSCDIGYSHTSGDLNRTCQADTTWSGDAPVCTISTCTSPAAVSFASVSPSQASYDYATSITYSCDIGYSHTSGDLNRTCQADTTWSGDAPVCTINTCASPAAISFASVSPSQASYDYATSITYYCDIGYSHTSGDLNRTCQADSTWSGVAPVCTINTCASPAAVSFASVSPSQASYDYATSITYICDTGYSHTSGDLNRTCQVDSTWSGDAPVCTVKTCASPAAVSFASVLPSQASYDYTTSITYTCDTGYSHSSGDLSRTCQADTTWSGDAPVCTINTCTSPAAVSFASVSPSQASYDYATSIIYTCDAGYLHTSGDLNRTCQADATWSGDAPVCTIKTCASPAAVSFASVSPSQASYDYATSITYICDTGYSHTNGDLSRTCQADTTWSGDAPVCTINTCTSPTISNSFRSPDQETYDYQTSVTYSCDTGYTHTSGDLTRTCQANSTWSGDEPVCTINTCTNLTEVPHSSRSPDQVTYDYATTVTYLCDTGYEKSAGDLMRTCQADTTWSGTEPVCTIVTCSDPGTVSYSSKTPIQSTFNYSASLTYSCDFGYSHTSGDLTRTCQADKTWSGTTPVCTINTCVPDLVPNSSKSPDLPSYDYGTSVTYNCDLVYNHTSGDLNRDCQANRTWTGIAPVCTVVACLPHPTIAFGTLSSVKIKHEFGESLTITCDLGYYISSGNDERTCQTNGNWNGTEPVCSIVTCTAPAPVLNATVTPAAPYTYNTIITYTCDLSFIHTSGDLTRTCQADFNWSGTAPVCTVDACIGQNSTFMTVTPNQLLYDFGDLITYTCFLGYNYSSGDLQRTCQTDGSWSGTLPECVIVTCLRPSVPDHSSIAPTDAEIEFDNLVTYTCDLGYNRTDGDETRRCTETGEWTGTEANCTLVTCNAPADIPYSSFQPDQSIYNYSATVTYSCYYGYFLSSGSLTTQCDETASWTGPSPVCSIVECATIAVQHSTYSPSQVSFEFNTTVTYTCDIGHNRTSGNDVRMCQNDTTWDGDLPVCDPVVCSFPETVPFANATPSQAQYVYQDLINYTCILGYEVTSGNSTRQCNEHAEWTGSLPVCTIVKCAPPVNISNASYEPVQSIYNYSTVVTYACDYGYYLSSGSLTTQCDESKAWSGTIPVCSIVQCNAIPVLHSTYSPTQTIFDFNTTIAYNCDIGHNRTSGDEVRTCQNDTTWNGDLPVCDPVVCSFPETVDFSTSTPTQAEYVYEDRINYTCVFGYEMTSGNASRQCDEHGEWTGTLPNCTIVKCTPPVNISKASYEPVQSIYNYSTVVTYACDYGYYLSSGSLTVQCDVSKTWNGSSPVCSVVQCNAIPVLHSTYSPTQAIFDFNTTITYNCDTGHNRTGGNDVRTCQNDTTWDGNLPVCDPVVCSFPEIVDFSTSTPSQAEYVYEDRINYTCVFGYEMTSGNASRQCDENAEWTGTLPNCTIKTCVPPLPVQNTSYSPVLLEHNWNTSVMFSCDVGYEYVSGDSISLCLDNKTWSGDPFLCTIKKCPRINVENATISPTDNGGEYDYLTEITYECVLGYNHSAGDLQRTCLDTKDWSGDLPTCSIVTCDPPADIPHTNYAPTQDEYIWQTVISYECDSQYHFVSGENWTVCNESGIFPPVDFNCSAMHTLVKNAAEPSFAWINETSTSDEILFDFDGMCDVTLSVSPISLNVSRAISGTSLTVTVSEMTATTFGTYVVTLSPFRLSRSFANVTTNVYYGRAVSGLQGWVNNPITTLMVDGEYDFEVNTTDGTTVKLDWDFEGVGVVTQYFSGNFSSAVQNHTFHSPGDYNVTVTASNAISSQTVTIPVKAIYGPNNITFIATTNTPNTTQTIDLTLKIKRRAYLPMYQVNITVYFGDDTANFTNSEYIGTNLSLPAYYDYSHLYPIQGDYYARARVQSWVGYKEYSQTIRVWDSLDNLELDYVSGNGIYITNSTAEFEFVYPPEAGFLYTIDYGDGSSVSLTDTEMYKHPYNLTSFTHVYTSPGVYNLRWTAQNGLYSRDETKVIIVQNPVPSHSYSLEPVGKKYPWSVLQVTYIPFNITLNDTVALPTNATCDFDAGDGTSVVRDLEYDERFFQHLHQFLVEGHFQPSFNCSNLVSSYDYIYNITVMKYQANFTKVVFESLVPLNISDSATVYFHIENDGFAWLPYNVTLTFDFGNGEETHAYNQETFTRTYTARGNYNVTVTAESSVTSTSYTHSYPLRLGIMYFAYNSSVSFINSTVVTYSMHGVLGNTNYTVVFTDGSQQKMCLSTDIGGCDIHHLCPAYSNNTNVVTASNGTFVEIDKAYVVCDNPIIVTLHHPEFQAIPDGIIDLQLKISEDDLYIPNLFCDISMGDPIKRDTVILNQTVTFEDPFNYTFQYIALGRHGIHLYCWNLINETRIDSMITLTNKDFLFLGTFDRQYSQSASPLPVSTMLDVELFSRLLILANSSTKYAVNDWQIPVDVGGGTDRHSVLIPVGQVQAGLYQIILRTYFREEVDNAIFEPTFVSFISPPPQVHIIGGRLRRLARGTVILDAHTLSFDPVNPAVVLTFGNWRCFGYDATTFIEAENKSIVGSGGTPCTLASVNGAGNMSLDLSASPQKPYYVVEVTGESADGLNATNSQIIQVIDNTIALNIRCLINCMSKVAVTSYLQVIVDTDHNCPAFFTWTLQLKGGDSVSLTDKTDTGVNNRSLSIKPNTLLPGKWYVISVRMTYNGAYHGPAYYEFLTNMPPQEGTCDVYQFDFGALSHTRLLSTSETYSTVLRNDEFNITCSYWLDEGFTESTFMENQPLFYNFYFKYGPDDEDRQILYFDPGSTSNLVTVRIGNPETGYTGNLIIRIADIIGDYTEITYNLIVTPPDGITTTDFLPLDDSAQLAILTQFTALYEEDLIKANRTWDYRTLSRKIQDVTSVYNQLVLNSTATILLTPEDLLTLGNQRNENGEILSWNEYWSLIVEVKESEASNHLIKFGERMTAALYYTVNTWPTNKRMPLVSIEVISKGLSATLERIEYTNITAAIYAAYSSDKMAADLVLHTQDREFPSTEQFMCAMSGLFELNMYILKFLQTVLTPNLPEDPTVDEMRSYLEYIKIFEGVDDSYNKSLLSLQEQTFLAQKQLQRYHLQKYLKSEASKTALPKITVSLENIGSVLKSMSTLGRQELRLENDFIYLSVEKARKFELQHTDIIRPRAIMEVGTLSEHNPGKCNASEVSITTTIFKSNPYFWGTFADRITSYVSTFTLDSVTILDPTIMFRLQNYITAPCNDVTPVYDEADENKMIYILFNRRYQDDDMLLFIRPEATELTYEVYFKEGEKPDLEEESYTFKTQIHTNMWTQEDGYKLLVKSNEFSATGQIWIALRPILGENDDESVLQKKFCAKVTSVNCVVWKEGMDGEYSWNRHMCEVSELSSRSETVCVCQNPSDMSSITIGTTFYVPESKVDFQTEEDQTLAYSMQAVYIIIYATVGTYVVLLLVLWREDMKDPYKWSYSLLIDNDIADQHFYIIRVYTGMRSGSGTKSNIAFILAGENGDTGIRILDDNSHLGFERGSVRTFVMGTRKDLGELMSIRIWHDDTGVSEAAWYLNQITVTDLTSFRMYGFYGDTWFDYDKGDQRVDRVLSATPIHEAWSFKEMVSYTIAEHHMWISVFLRPFRSSFTRVQRLSCLLGMVYLNMFLCTLFLKTKTKEEINAELVIGPLRFSNENFKVALIAVSVSTILVTMVSFLFRFARSKTHLLFRDTYFVRQYKRFNDRFNFDKTILNMHYPLAQDALAYDYNFLPQFVTYVAWTLLALFVGLSALFMLTGARGWPEIKTEEWMTTVIVSGLVSFLIIDVIKIILIIIPYLLLCKRAYEPPRPYIDVETLKEIAKYNSASLTISPDFSNDLKAAVSPDEDTLLAHKKERMNNHQLLKMFSQLALYSGILYIVYTISYAKRDTLSYSLKKNIEDSFSFNEVTDIDSYNDWLTGRFAEQYFSHSFFGKTYTEVDIKHFAEDLVNYRVGPARLRQLRIEPESCKGPLGEGKTCYSKYRDSNLDKENYCVGWVAQPCDVAEKSDYFTSPAWEFISADEVWGFFTMATYATYGGGGYFMKLDVNKEVCLKIFEELARFNWFDRKTRVSILEFTLYNANKNLFVYSKFVAEFPEVGGVITFTDVQVFRLYLNTGKDGEFILLLEFLFALLVIGATFKMTYEIATDGCKYFKSVWNLLDIMALLMSYTTIIVYIYKLSVLDKTISLFHADKNAYVGFENLAFFDYFVNTTHALLVFILSVRVSKILGYSGKINEMAAVISSSANDLGGFFLIFAISYFAYVILGTELFRNDTEKYKDLFQTYGTLTEAIVGKNRLANILISKPGYAEFYYFTFVLFVLLTLATLAAAILNFSITHVKEEQKKMAPTNIVEILADRISWLFRMVSEKLSRKSNADKYKYINNDDDEEEADAKEVLGDIGSFIKNELRMSIGNVEDFNRGITPSKDTTFGSVQHPQ